MAPRLHSKRHPCDISNEQWQLCNFDIFARHLEIGRRHVEPRTPDSQFPGSYDPCLVYLNELCGKVWEEGKSLSEVILINVLAD